MTTVELYRKLYAHEKHSNNAMLSMIESVPETKRSDPRFQQAVTLADHLAACRENWLNWMVGGNRGIADWSDETADVTTLRPRYAALEGEWTDFLAALTEERAGSSFEVVEADGSRVCLKTEVQVMQLAGHASYHRGQIALLVDQLGGETVDTDYVYWILEDPSRA